MPDFRYTARELTGRQVTGTLAAPSERDVLSQLSAQNLFPIDVRAVESAQAQKKRRQRSVSPRLLSSFYAQLSDLLQAGVPLLRAMALLERQTRHPGLRQVIQEVREEVADGSRLGEALRQHPAVFSDLTISIVRAGEEGSFLEDSLRRIAEFTEHQEELKGKVIGAMAYPAFLLVVGTIVVTLMLVYFVPKFEPMFASMRDAGGLPWATTTLLAVSNTLQKQGWLLLLGLAGGGLALSRWLDGPEGRLRWDKFQLVVPGMGQVVRSLAISRFCRVLGTLLKNGVPLLGALNIAKDATGNRVIADAIGAAAEHVSSGRSLAQPLAESKQFPLDVQEMIAVGEEANNLEVVLITIADKMERNTNRQLELAVRLLEPMMLVMMAGLVMFVVIALMLPILQSSSVV